MAKLIVVYWTPLQENEFLKVTEYGPFKDMMKRAEELKTLPETYAVQVIGDDDDIYENWFSPSLNREMKDGGDLS